LSHNYVDFNHNLFTKNYLNTSSPQRHRDSVFLAISQPPLNSVL
jgi:hypothetical protein